MATDPFQAMLDHATASEEQYNCQKQFGDFLHEPGETQNSKFGRMLGGLALASVFETCCHVLALKFQRCYQDLLSLSWIVLLYHMQPDKGYVHIMSINCSSFFI